MQSKQLRISIRSPKRRILISFALAGLLVLSGCTDGKPSNDEFRSNELQDRYISLLKEAIEAHGEGMSESFVTTVTGTLPNRETLKKGVLGNQAVKYLLTEGAPNAENWNGKVFSLSDEGDHIVVAVSHNDQIYQLYLFDEEAIQSAPRIKKENRIQFSGKLQDGDQIINKATSFRVYPTELRTKDYVITQSPERIAAQRKADENAIYKAEFEKDTIEECKSILKEDARYPESVFFSLFGGDIEWLSDKELKYSDVINSKNQSGNTIPRRFLCTATKTTDGNTKLSVVYFDR
jgi:hypothetical protein